jgi:N-acetylneuraminic acid mutarotase
MKRKCTLQSASVRGCLDEGGFLNMRACIAVLLCAFAACSVLSATLLAFFSPQASLKVSERTLSFAERVTYQRAIENVYWRHRIWPKERPDPKPPLDAVMSQAQLEKKVEDYRRNSQALDDHWQRLITAEDLQAEMDRMAKNTKQPEVLRELFEALGNDPFLIAECLARPVLSERLITSFAQEQRKVRLASSEVAANNQRRKVILADTTYTLPIISYATTGCPDAWANTSRINAPGARFGHTAVWTGTEMIVWGGNDGTNKDLKTGGRYNPSLDSWTATSMTNAPTARAAHTAVWTGSEMIVWGGYSEEFGVLNTGGRYNPDTDSWMATSTTNTPSARVDHTVVWARSEMIVWGGVGSDFYGVNTGGRYNPSSDTWTATTTTNAPDARSLHTAVWTGSEMIVWGGAGFGIFNTGGRYNPRTDTWTATSTTNAPEQRAQHTAVWTDSQMIVWGGTPDLFDEALHNGGIYNPSSDSWTATNTHHAPDSRELHTAVWTGSEMIVWGGVSGVYPHGSHLFNTGGRYNPSTDSWLATTTIDAPHARAGHTAVWTGSEMIVWGGTDRNGVVNTGGRYCAQSSPR